MSICNIDRQAMQAVRLAVDAALKTVAKELGVGLSLGNGSYSGQDGHFKLNVVPIGISGEIESPERKAWPLYAKRFGFEVSDLGKKFFSGGNEFFIDGIVPSRPKFPILAKRIDGKRFKMTALQVRHALNPNQNFSNLQIDGNDESDIERRIAMAESRES